MEANSEDLVSFLTLVPPSHLMTTHKLRLQESPETKIKPFYDTSTGSNRHAGSRAGTSFVGACRA